MFILYDLIFLIFTLAYLPIYLFKGKFHHGFLARLGALPKDLKLDKPIWIHAVSVGEAKAVAGLINELRKTCKDKKFIISTVTPTGNKIARTMAGAGDFVTYLPLDFSFIVKRVINKIKPEAFIIAETEIWPNLISCLHKRGIPVITVNGRISDASFKGYSAIKFLIKPILSKVSLFCMQTESDANKLEKLGVAPDKIKITGNMKFDQLISAQGSGYRTKLGLSPEERLFIAGSTHSGEEEIVLGSYAELLRKFPKTRLLIAPRHPERALEVEKMVLKNGFSVKMVSWLTGQPVNGLNQLTRPSAHPPTVLILDTIGELVNFYAAGDIVFIGGSLVKKGGQNILEPASAGKPVIFGPHMFNFRDIVKMFLENDAAIMINNQEELIYAVVNLLNDSAKVDKLVANARGVIAKNQGATLRNAVLVREFIA